MSAIIEADESSDGIIEAQCNFCKHLKRGTVTCIAFPERIPDQILSNQWDHTSPIEGDHGIQFEPNRAGEATIIE